MSNINSPVTSLNVYYIKSKKEKISKVNGRPFCSLTYRTSGMVEIDINGKSFISEAGCITFIPKNQRYSTEIIEDTQMIAIHFNALDEKMFNVPFIIENTNHKLYQLFDSVLQSYSAENPNNFECYSHFFKILAEIEDHFIKKQEGKINPAIKEAKSKIDKNFIYANFNIDTLVSELSVCSSYLRREFKKHYSFSPVEYLKYVRLQNALSLLASSYYSVEEIAEKSGYNSTSYFIQSFRKSTGYSPLKYKEKFLTLEK